MKTKILFLVFFTSQISFAQNFKFGKVSKEELQETQNPKYPSANAAILYREPVVHLNNANFQIVHISIKDKFIDVLNNS